MSGCYPYKEDTPHCGRHCAHVNSQGNPCVLEPHGGDVHVHATPPCDPKAAFKFARSPAPGPLCDNLTVGDPITGHTWRWNIEYAAWEDCGPIGQRRMGECSCSNGHTWAADVKGEAEIGVVVTPKNCPACGELFARAVEGESY